MYYIESINDNKFTMVGRSPLMIIYESSFQLYSVRCYCANLL